MGKSARILGQDFGGRTAREMNVLLKQYGYLEGRPGAYNVTEKGRPYVAREQYHHRGTGGYAHYNRYWDTVTWNDALLDALRADMESNPGGGFLEDVAVAERDDNAPSCGGAEPVDAGESGDGEGSEVNWAAVAIAGALVAVVRAAPHAKPFYRDRVKPAAQKLQNKLRRRKPAAGDLELMDGSPESGAPVAQGVTPSASSGG